MNAIGLMSGTSLDGVDAALVRTDGACVFAHGPSLTVPYPPGLRTRLRALLDEAPHLTAQSAQVLEIEREVTDIHAQAVRLIRAAAPDMVADVVGFHGQTILHAPGPAARPEGGRDGAHACESAREQSPATPCAARQDEPPMGQHGRTWQIGDAARLSASTGLPVVHDFRSADVQAGGQGAPLAPLYHAALLQGRPGPVAVLNIGGVANLTLLGATGHVWACDTGPGNALLDDWTQRHTGQPYDRDGALAARGTVHGPSLAALMAHPFFAAPPPKSLDRLSFHAGLEQIARLDAADGAATLAAFTAEAVARTPLPEQPGAWYVCGGGRHNPAIMAALAQRLAGPVRPVEDLGWKGDALEAECFGFLAVRSLRGLPLSLPATTGVPTPLRGGQLTCAGITPWGMREGGRIL
ncbi:anhydro-N-acetylmuramic acid kinase [Acetobacter sp. TBRC 12305]|uniref:Anhydro-N-acetylmuramic acid kinase n=2 Tax=Acetobacter garciniae TaxID=2817435 RepID=A0A939HN37_9PROT|nr:anhydro-N-acetylmuramic acid kinase [Acetobacter garciniae]MBO1325266.1 anhydro-N-acetylmuramic acid kinase [Acetobacter garciniae]MBX0344762.1 anhydro-N-acetylmuramic acid kinase [Acetobacter garciniae]